MSLSEIMKLERFISISDFWNHSHMTSLWTNCKQLLNIHLIKPCKIYGCLSTGRDAAHRVQILTVNPIQFHLRNVCSAYYLMTVSPFFLILAVPHLWIPLDKAPQFNDESLLRAVRSRYFSLWKLMASLCPPALKLVANISNGKYISSAFLTGSFGQEKKTWEIHTHNRNLHCHK